MSGRSTSIRFSSLSSWVTSCRFAPVAAIDSGTPRPSTRRRRLLPFFSPVGGVVPDRLQEIAELCKLDAIFDGWVFPGYDTGGRSQLEELRARVYKGCAQRYGELSDREIGRIEFELDVIGKKGFATYFLVIDDIVRMSEAENRRRRTCGRGSGAASIVSYGLGITNVDPLRHNLYFERFLNLARPDPPDLDIDFAWDERDDLINAVIARFGRDHCARVANHNFFRFSSALRETAKAHGYADAEITDMAKRLRRGGEKTRAQGEQWAQIFDIAKRIGGLPRGHALGRHSHHAAACLHVRAY